MGVDDEPVLLALGASAGGLEALRALFLDVPKDTRFAFVVIQHLSPDHRSMMVELLTRHTALEVREAEHRARPEPGTIDFIQPHTLLRLSPDGELLVEDLEERSNLRPIDTFMESLAENARGRFGGVILSGTGSDGAKGLAAIHEAGGVTAVQPPESAGFDGMPRAALRSHEPHVVADPNVIVSELEQVVSIPGPLGYNGSKPGQRSAALNRIFDRVRSVMGVDFGMYKPTMISRRIERRMEVHELDDPASYAELVGNEDDEVEALTGDLLIGVTRFGRDAGAIASFKDRITPRLVERARIEPLRLWVAGCSSGEEAYTVAMLLQDALDSAGLPGSFRLFATDISRDAVQLASRGEYGPSLTEQVPEPWLDKYFTRRSNDRYQIRKSIRDSIIFSVHNVIEDPPFTRLDLVTCRNLLIYLRVSIQERVLKGMSNSLHDGGLLWLGPSETVGALDVDFETLDRRWKIYSARSGRKRRYSGTVSRLPSLMGITRTGTAIREETDRLVQGLSGVLKGYVPPLLLVDGDFNLIHRSGEVGRLLRVPEGRFSNDVREMLPRELAAIITTAAARARESHEDIVYADLQLVRGEEAHLFDLRFRRIHRDHGQTSLFALFFEGLKQGEEAKALQVPTTAVPMEIQAQLEAYERELRATRESLQTTIEELEAANEELQSTNEELLASNEELQATNEELQALNEELHTVNAEHQDRLEELAGLSSDLTSLLGSLEVGVVVVSDDLVLRRFNEAATYVFNLIDNDVGRPFEHITHKMAIGDLVPACRRVSSTAQPEEHATTVEDRSILVQITPRLMEGSVQGAVVVVTDVSRVAQVQRRARHASAALDLAMVPLCILNPQGTITEANASFAELTGRDVGWIVGQDFRELSHEREFEFLSAALEQAKSLKRWSGIARGVRPDGRVIWENLDLIPLPSQEGQLPAILLLSTPLERGHVAPEHEPNPDAFFLWKAKSDQVNGSPGLADLFGHAAWAGGSLKELMTHVVPDDFADLRTQADEAQKKGTAFEQPCRVLVHGQSRPLTVRMQPILHPPAGGPVMVARCHRLTSQEVAG